ncbi:hypothetical protein, partial [Pseudomonas sp. MPR-R2A5]|uniref:hypothetical protein n=1 Tax=Pseudomonas sp. MPR-R2A5 TaxID=2070622 RepID=UPI001C458C7D
ALGYVRKPFSEAAILAAAAIASASAEVDTVAAGDFVPLTSQGSVPAQRRVGNGDGHAEPVRCPTLFDRPAQLAYDAQFDQLRA